MTESQKMKIVDIIDRIAVFFFAVLIFFLPISNAAIESCFGFIYLCFITRCFFKRPTLRAIREFFANRVNLSLLVFYCIAGISMLATGSLIGKSFNAWFFKWGEGFLLFYFAQVFIKKEHIKYLLVVFFCSAFLICINGIYQKIFYSGFIRNFNLSILSSNSGIAAVRSTFLHYNDFSSYLTVIFFLTLGFFLDEKKIIRRLFIFCLFSVLLVNLLFTLSRGAWLALIVVSFFSIIIFFSKRRIALSLFILAILAGTLFLIPGFNGRLVSIFQVGGDAGRFFIWKTAMLMFKESPLLGRGPGLFMDYMNSYQYRGMSGLGFASPLYAHNCYLQILAEMGIFGLLSFFWFLGELLKKGYRRTRKSGDFLLLGILLALVAFLIHSFFDTQFYSLKLSILFWLLVSFLGVCITKESPKVITRN
ncbi:MAG: O-antigen ligase family protein [Candidatus Omnitrophica bacterium]|nr:O-antigen ligase family protein [Candidatus Omnitrophota bacterium]